MEKPYLKIAKHYNDCFQKHGLTPKGLDWDNQENLNKRYEVMYNLIKNNIGGTVLVDGVIANDYTLLDFGCGYGDFYKWLRNFNKNIKYTGLDINKNLLEQASNKYPNQNWHLLDIHNQEFEFSQLPIFNFCIMNGVFTVKNTLTQEEMWKFMTLTLKKLWDKTDKGMAFNCMSKILDYERDDLFHVSFDELGSWIYSELQCSKFTFRQDYGLREFTCYIYK